MFEIFPPESAEEWDITGITSGLRNAKISKVAVALDATLDAVMQAKSAGCNLVVTHHPAYIGERPKPSSGHLIYAAKKHDVALMNFHTVLDVSNEGASMLPKLLNLKVQNVLVPTYKNLGLGRVCTTNYEKPISLSRLVKKCEKAFCRSSRVWGNFSTQCMKIAVTTGSTGGFDDKPSILQATIDNNCDCIVCGEIKYHDALEIANKGICIIDLGHDVSELPLVAPLINAIIKCGIDKNNIVKIDQNNYWI